MRKINEATEMSVLAPFVIPQSWQVPYWGRQLSEEYSQHFSPSNGAYPVTSNETIRLNLKTQQDENGRIKSISYYKIKDSSANYFMRPVSHDMPITKSDIKKFVSLLQICTVDRAQAVLNQMLADAGKKTMANNWRIVRTTNKSIIMENADVQVVIPITVIKRAIDLSHSYIDVLYSECIWEANSDILPVEYAQASFALLSLIDMTIYADIDKLRREAAARVTSYESTSGYIKLRTAVVNNDNDKVIEYAKYANVKCLVDEMPLLFIAIDNNNMDILQTLLMNGADVNETSIVEHSNYGRITAIGHAIINKLDNAFDVLLRYKQMPSTDGCQKALWMKRLDLLERLLDNGEFCFYFSNDPEMISPCILHRFSKYPTIEWNAREIRTVYEAGDKSAAMSMIKAWKTSKENSSIGSMMSYLIQHHEYELACECVSNRLHDAWNEGYLVKQAVIESLRLGNPKWSQLIKSFGMPHVIQIAISSAKKEALTDASIPVDIIPVLYNKE